MIDLAAYRAFLKAKIVAPAARGFDVPADAVHPSCRAPGFEHQGDIVRWMVRGGRRACFANFGLGKSSMQLDTGRLVLDRRPDGFGLIVAPLLVSRVEFMNDARRMGIPLTFVQTTQQMLDGGPGLYTTNYESVREGKIDQRALNLVFLSLDEAAEIRNLGSKTFREFYRRFQDVPYRYVATATPAPNDYIEILNYAMFLGVMDIGEAKTRFFRRNSERSDDLTLHPHKVDEFWGWVRTWAIFLQTPAELGYADDQYRLPKLTIRWHKVGVDHSGAGAEKNGQHRLLKDAALGLRDDAAARRDSIDARIAKVRELVLARPDDHVLIWHHLERERLTIEADIPDVAAVYGTQELDAREELVGDFANGRLKRLAAKPSMLGSGCNLQRHCHWAIVAGPHYNFEELIQAFKRIHRFLQTDEVLIDFVFAESQAKVRAVFLAKLAEHEALMQRMSALVRQYGLSETDPEETLRRSIGVARRELRGPRWTAINNDAVEEAARQPDNTYGFTLTSVPFSSQYEYTPSYNDFGHTDDEAHFWRQQDFLTPNLFRTLQPGRCLVVHVKDRVRPGGYDGRSFQTIAPFHCNAVLHYMRHGFALMSIRTLVTDVVRENFQTGTSARLTRSATRRRLFDALQPDEPEAVPA